MEQYIKKSALLAEIERRIELFTIEKNQEDASQIDKLSLGGRIAGLQELKVFLNTFEVKEVNEVPATVMVNQYGLRFISSWSGLKEYDDFKKGEEIKILIPKK